MPKLSEYEIEREANIARNRALLQQLDLQDAVSTLDVPKPAPNPKAKPIQAAKRVKKEKEEDLAPRRTSRRLRGPPAIDPNESPEKKRKREAEEQEQRAKEAEEAIEAEERARAAKRPRHHVLDIATLVGDAEPQNNTSLSGLLQDLTLQPKRVGIIAAKQESQEAREVKELQEKLKGLKVVSRAKVTEDRIYSAAYHPELTKDLVFFGDKHGQLGIWDARAPADEIEDEDGDISKQDEDDQPGGKYWRLQTHWPATSKSSISSVKFNPVDSHSVYTSAYDCTIRSLSFTTSTSREIYHAPDALISSIDLPPSGNEMWISDSLGGLTHLDLREDGKRPRWYALSEQKIGSVSINPREPHFLLTASNSRALKIWDARKLDSMPVQKLSTAFGTDTSIPLEFDSETVQKYLDSKAGQGTFRGEWTHGKSVSSAYWDPRGRSVVSTSYDDQLRLWDLDTAKFNKSSTAVIPKPFSSIKHDCQTGRWLTILRAQWSANADAFPHFTVGNMGHSLDIYSCKGDLLAKLTDRSKITAVQAVTCSHPNVVERAASGNGSGRCVLWAPADA